MTEHARNLLRRMAFGGALSLTFALSSCQPKPIEPVGIELPIGDERVMILGAATHFAQGWPRSYLKHIHTLEVPHVRDSIYWELVEQNGGEYVFDHWRTTYPDNLAEIGVDFSITITGNHALYDDGVTVYKPEDVEALSAFLSETADRFPGLTAIEIGNEINSENFLKGPMLEADYPERVALYSQQLSGVSETIKATRPDMTIIGGAAHSVPVDFLDMMFDHDAAGAMDALAIHPYKTEPEHLDDELAVLRRQLGEQTPPIHVTEFGVSNPIGAADYLMKVVAVMATQGVEVAYWYAMVRQTNSDSVPLIEKNGELTDAGRAFRFAQRHLLSHPIRNISPDTHTYVFSLGDRMMLLWGEPRTLETSGPMRAFDATGTALETVPETLDPDQVVILVSNDPLRLDANVVLGPSPIIVDTFHDYHFEPATPDKPSFERFFIRNGERIDAQVFGGGDRKNSRWNPHFGHRNLRPIQIAPTGLVPVAFRTDDGLRKVDIVHRYTAQEPETVRLRARWTPREESVDGLAYEITLNGRKIRDATFTDPVDVTTAALALSPGDEIDIRLGVHGDPRNDVTSYRYQILKVEDK
ncbi:MAG: glycosyl hydrolase [Pseudomonadota bacterium]